ncbi:MAG: hypothetical protein OXE42_08615, partial [Gammaproteobacteria bacterium]|nr:hypothetical protein [Gammaproteobacteria bacterium]
RREWRALVKGCNAVLASLCGSLRAGREAGGRGVTPLGKDAPFPVRRALRSTASRPAEHVNIKLKEY